jgi:hypothetical protein
VPLLTLVLAACARPIDRPLDGAPPVETQGRVFHSDSGPPTLVPPTRAPTRLLPTLAPPPATPTPIARPPLIQQRDPLPNGQVFAGNVRFTLQVTASAALDDVSAALDGQDVQPHVDRREPQTWWVSFVRGLEPGTHEVNVQARDRAGLSSTLHWQFQVVPSVGVVTTPAAPPPLQPTLTPVPPLSAPSPPAPSVAAVSVLPTARPTSPPATAPPAPDAPAQPTARPTAPTPSAAPAGSSPTSLVVRKARPTATPSQSR